MKMKLMILFGALFVAGACASLNAQPRVAFGFSIGGPAYSGFGYGGYYGGYRFAPPPPPLPPVYYAAPGPGYRWINGYWYPAGPRYNWGPGYRMRPPYPRSNWVAPRYYGGRSYRGNWRR